MWGILYLTLIPVSATVYAYILKDGFVHTNAIIEPTIIADKGVIAGGLTSELQTNFQEVHGSNVVNVGAWSFQSAQLGVTDISFHGDACIVGFWATAFWKPNKEIVGTVLLLRPVFEFQDSTPALIYQKNEVERVAKFLRNHSIRWQETPSGGPVPRH